LPSSSPSLICTKHFGVRGSEAIQSDVE
jgi:hypothetical protein